MPNLETRHPENLLQILAQAQRLVEEFPGCFWYRHQDYQMTNLEDAILVIKHLREHGGHKEWQAAQQFYQCLLQNFNEQSLSSLPRTDQVTAISAVE